jgi:hypothetical protein
MEKYFDDCLLETFANTFYGYGDYHAPYWFIGMEEGGGDSFDNIKKRLSAWNADGRPELEDVAEFHRTIGLGEYFDEQPKRQPTWDKLTRLLLSAKELLSREDQDLQRKQVQEYRQTSLGKVSGGENCLIELLPLPSPSTSDWIYAQHSRLPQLKNRKEYKKHYIDRRVKHIQERINQYRPQVVVFYSTTYLKWWKQIADAPFSFDQMHVAHRNGTLFVVTDHPARRGRGYEYFHEIGQKIASELAIINE